MAAAAVRRTGGRADCGALTVPRWRRPRRRLSLAGEPDRVPPGQPHPLPGRVPAPRCGPRRGDLLRGRTARGARGERRRRGGARTHSGGGAPAPPRNLPAAAGIPLQRGLRRARKHRAWEVMELTWKGARTCALPRLPAPLEALFLPPCAV